ncbi:hypothetical protein GCM10027048_39460 [Hymenobacter coalescens]
METDKPRLPEQPGGQPPVAPFKPFQLPPPSPEKGDLPIVQALYAIVLTALIGAGLMTLSTNVFREYGWVLFVGSPLVAGMIATLLYSVNTPRSSSESLRAALWVVWLSAIVCSLGLLVTLHVEGLICVAMTLPIALPLAAIGGLLGHGLLSLLRSRPQRLQAVTALVLLYPAAQLAEVQMGAAALPRTVTTRLHVQAAPGKVWQVLNRPVRYPAAVGPLFKAGVAYPVRTALVMDAKGGRALECVYSQGRARLPISVWQPGRELEFRVPETPAPMRELSPYPQLHAPHLHGYFHVDRGTFRLLAEPDGSTLLEATTVYRHSIGPRAYWQLWSDYLLDDMHHRVLTAIKTQAEHE